MVLTTLSVLLVFLTHHVSGFGTTQLPIPSLDVSQTISQRIDQDSRRIGSVARNLLEVQDSIDRVEEEVQGKVFDMETLRNFLNAHKEINEENARLLADIPLAKAKLSDLTAALNKVRGEALVRDTQHNKNMRELQAALAAGHSRIGDFLRSKLVQPRVPVSAPASAPAGAPAAPGMSVGAAPAAAPAAPGMSIQPAGPTLSGAPSPDFSSPSVPSGAPSIPGVPIQPFSPLQPENATFPPVQSGNATLPPMQGGNATWPPEAKRFEEGMDAEKQRLQQANDALAKTQAQKTAEGAADLKALEAARAELLNHKKMTQALEQELLKQHTYAQSCHSSAEKLREQLEVTKGKVDAAANVAQALRNQEKKQQEAVYADNYQLKERLKKAKANLATIQSQILMTKEQHDALHAEGQEQLGKLRQALGKLRQHHDATESELNVRVKARAELEMAVRKVEEEVRRLQEMLMSGELAALRRNNTQLKANIKMSHTALMDSQVALMYTQSNISRANETLHMLKQEAEEIIEEARRAAQDALEKIAAAKQADDEAQAKAEAVSMQAEARLMTDCDGIWKEEHPQVFEELEHCKQVKSDLTTANAMLAALTSTVQAAKAS